MAYPRRIPQERTTSSMEIGALPRMTSGSHTNTHSVVPDTGDSITLPREAPDEER